MTAHKAYRVLAPRIPSAGRWKYHLASVVFLLGAIYGLSPRRLLLRLGELPFLFGKSSCEVNEWEPQPLLPPRGQPVFTRTGKEKEKTRQGQRIINMAP
jgi:hypothetical protein